MPLYEYLTLPAPRKADKVKGAKTPEARIAQAMQSLLNEQAAEGWDYLRADLVPMEERAGLTSKSVSYHTVLVFRRLRDSEPHATIAPQSDEIEAEGAPLRKSPVADRNSPPPAVPFPGKTRDAEDD